MSLIAATSIAASIAAVPACSWDRPGHNPFMGDVVQAVDRYTDIPKPVRDALKRRMAKREYDEVVRIGRDRIAGQRAYAAAIRDMHFGQGSVCRTVTRARWTDSMQERGLVYCEAEHCILVPTVCRNVSRIDRLPEVTSASVVAPTPGIAATPVVPELAEGDGELEFDAPAAGPRPDDGASFEQRTASAWSPPDPSSHETPSGLWRTGRLSPGATPPPSMPPPTTSTPRVPWTPTAPPVTPVPEPMTSTLLLAGLAALGFALRRRAQR